MRYLLPSIGLSLFLIGCGGSGENVQLSLKKSFFEYTDPYHAKGNVFLKELEIIKDDNLTQNLFLRIDNIEVPECSVDFEATDKKVPLIDSIAKINVAFKNECYSDRMILYASEIIENNFKLQNGTAQRIEVKRILPIVLENKHPIEPLKKEYEIRLSTLSKDNILYPNEDAELEFALFKKSQELDPKKVKELIFVTNDGDKIKFLDENGFLVNRLELGSGVSEGKIKIKTFNDPGAATIKVVYKVEDESGIVFKKSDEVPFLIKGLPDISYHVVISPTKNTFQKGGVERVDYSIISALTGEVIPSDKIKRIEIFALTPNIKIIKDNYELSNAYFIDKNISGKGSFLVKVIGKGIGTIKVLASVEEGTRLVPLVSVYQVEILDDKANAKFALNYIGTEYNESTNLFYDKFYLRSSSNQPRQVKVSALFPFVHDVDFDHPPSNFYTQENPYVLYDGETPPNRGEIFSKNFDDVYFKSTIYDFSALDPQVDKLLVIPNAQRQDAKYLGLWQIKDVTSSNTLSLYGKGYKIEDMQRLSFVIGRNFRYDQTHDTIMMISLDNPSGIYELKDRQTLLTVSYPPAAAGKDVFIGIKEGNVFKRTFSGTKLLSSDIPICQKSQCEDEINLYFENGSPLVYSHIVSRCEGENVKDFYFVRIGQNPVRTDRNGNIKVVIKPEPIYKEVKENNQTVKVLDGYKPAKLSCEFRVAEEFSF